MQFLFVRKFSKILPIKEIFPSIPHPCFWNSKLSSFVKISYLLDSPEFCQMESELLQCILLHPSVVLG